MRVSVGMTIFLMAIIIEGKAEYSQTAQDTAKSSPKPAESSPKLADSSPKLAQSRQSRQLHRILDPFGLLGKAGKAVSGAVKNLGQKLDEGAQHVGKLVQEGAESLDNAFKNHIGQVQEGLKEAGKVAGMIGEDLVDSVSVLVSNQVGEERGEEAVRRREGIVDGFLRMVGIDSSQVGLMALNVLIFLAELITSSLIGEDMNEIPESRESKTSVLSWFMQTDPQKMEEMIREAQDPKLPRAIIDKLRRATGDNTACVQLLVCKISPVVWGLQRSVALSRETKGDPDTPPVGLMQTLYDALPPLDTFVKFSKSCEDQFHKCPLIDLSHLGLGL